ncbi:MAG: TetR/AcrR family transcriptional regulator, partial [Myxococcota bacterium]
DHYRMATSRSTSRPSGRAATRVSGERSRERILDAAERLLAERGYAAAGIAAISEASGLPASSIYWFFESKQDLTAAVVERSADRWITELTASAEAEASVPLSGLMKRALAQSGGKLPGFLRLATLLSLELEDPAILERLRRLRGRGHALIETALENALSGTGVREARRLARTLAPLAAAFVEGALVAEEVDPGRIDVERLAEDIEVALRAVAAHRLEGGRR